MKNTQIELLRKKNGISQEELAGQLGISRQTISEWERGLTYPSVEKLIMLSEIFDVSLDYLIKGKDYSKDFLNKDGLETYFKLSKLNNTDSFIFGKSDNMYVSVKDNKTLGNTLVVGGTGSGKSRCIIIPNLYQMMKRGESGIVMDFKSEFYQLTKDDFLKAGYKVKVLDFAKYKSSVGWNIVQQIKDLGKDDIYTLEKYAKLIYDSLFREEKDENIEYILFKSILYEMLNNDKIKNSLITVYDFIKYTDVKTLRQKLSELGINHPAKILESINNEDLTIYLANLLCKFDKVLSSQSIQNVLNTNEFDIMDLYNEKVILFIQDLGYDRNIGKLNGLFLDLFIYQAFDYETEFNGNINLFLDEFANFAYNMKTIKYLIKGAKGININVIAVVQSLSQLSFDCISTENIVNTFNNVIYLGSHSMYDLEFFSKHFSIDINVLRTMHNTKMFLTRNYSRCYELTKNFI